MRLKKLRANLIFLITPTTTWLILGYPYTTETQKVTRILKKNSSSNWIHSIHAGSLKDSHSTNLFINSCHHISNGKASPHSHINLQHHKIIPFALTKGLRSKHQPSKSGGYSTLINPFDETKFSFPKRVHYTLYISFCKCDIIIQFAVHLYDCTLYERSLQLNCLHILKWFAHRFKIWAEKSLHVTSLFWWNQ